MKETISKFARECSQATRMIVRHPRFFLIAVLVLSLGIGMSTALLLVGDAETGPRFTMLLFSRFGVLACVLAAVSVYGLAQRRREMGIRMALGAPRKSVLQLMNAGRNASSPAGRNLQPSL